VLSLTWNPLHSLSQPSQFRRRRQRPPFASGSGLRVIDAPLNEGSRNNATLWCYDHHGTFREKPDSSTQVAVVCHFRAVAVQRPPAGENGIGHRIFSFEGRRVTPFRTGPLPSCSFPSPKMSVVSDGHAGTSVMALSGPAHTVQKGRRDRERAA